MKQKELFFQYQGFLACVDADYDIKEKHNGYSTNGEIKGVRAKKFWGGGGADTNLPGTFLL